MRLNVDLSQEPYGATDINAISGNQGLSVGFNGKGTITVLKWPNPSYYDQIKYMTTRRDAENMGALDNEGAFSGIYYEAGGESGFFWLREALVEQRYKGDRSVVVVTSYKESRLGLDIEQVDFVAPDEDLLWRHYRVRRDPGSKVKEVKLVSYLNFSPQVSKYAFMPLRDWCLDEVGSSTLKWDNRRDLFIQGKEGRDLSAKEKSSVYLAFGFDKKSSSHQAGYDRSCSVKRLPGKKDAFKIAQRASLPGSDFAGGQVTAGLVSELEFNDRGVAEASLLISAAETKDEAARLVESGRAGGFDRALNEVEETWSERLKHVPVPATDDARIREVAMRSVISIILGYDRVSGAGVASISTQPPYGLDWPRDGVYMNLALIEAGFPGLARERSRFWARAQSRPDNKVRYVPLGNWASNYFADGVPGFPLIWWEIDETGYAIWGMVMSYLVDEDKDYLAEVYPAIRLAADFLVEFRDPETGLHKKSYEDDDPRRRQTMHGAVPCYIGLKYAAIAAEAMGDDESGKRWDARAGELNDAVLENFWDSECQSFMGDPSHRGDCESGHGGTDPGLMLYPAGMLEPGGPMAEAAADHAWEAINKSFSGRRDRGMYEVRGLQILAIYWQGRPDKLELVKRGIEWAATVPVTDTGHFGETWYTLNNEVTPGQGQPHLWHHSLFYLAAIKAYGVE
jgi:hypothetical protein